MLAVQSEGYQDTEKAILIKADTKEELAAWHGEIMNEAHEIDNDISPDLDWWSILFGNVRKGYSNIISLIFQFVHLDFDI